MNYTHVILVSGNVVRQIILQVYGGLETRITRIIDLYGDATQALVALSAVQIKSVDRRQYSTTMSREIANKLIS